ncbi:MAG TPA: hypothetical protein VKR56_09130 [Candidatus Cybelea sp.]|nr:hypothetical protein [Candidatus Cybelea sp.]
METKVARVPSVAGAFSKLIDYAGLFPPAALSLDRAQAEYQEARRGPDAWMLGRFIIPAKLLTESAAKLAGPFSVIVDGSREALARLGASYESGTQIEVLEVPLEPRLSGNEVPGAIERLREAATGAGFADLPIFAETPRSDQPSDVRSWMACLAAHKLGAKLRCGGVTADAFPTIDEVAEFIAAAIAANVPFKATAGLHHPVRHYNAQSGFTMHGFLNLLAAAAFASRVDLETLRRIVAEEDAGAFRFDANAFAWREQQIDATELAASRTTRFVAYGSCSFAEPIEDLTALGILSAR